MFCWGRKEKNPVVEPKAVKKLEQQQKRNTIISAFQFAPQPKEPELKSPPLLPSKKMISAPAKEQNREPQIASLENNCELVMFNSAEDRELFLSFIVKKTLIGGVRDTRSNLTGMDEQLFEVMAKRSRQQLTLIIVQHKDELMERKYHKYQQAYMLFMVIPQQLHYVSKLTTRSRIGMQNSIADDDFDKKQSKSRIRQGSNNMTASAQPTQKEERQGLPLEVLSFSTVNQVRLNFFDQIVVWSPYSKDTSLSASNKKWIEGVINGIQTLTNLEKTMIVLPRETEQNDIMNVLHDLIHEKIKSQPLELACNMIHFELECIYYENSLQRVVVKKRFQQGDLTMMLLAMSLLLLEFNDKSKQLYLQIIERLRKLTIKEYMAVKTSMKNGSYNKRAVLKAVRQHKLLVEDQILKLGEFYNDLPKIEDPWEHQQQYRFKVLRELRVQLSEFLSGRSVISSGSFNIVAESSAQIESGSSHSKQQEVIVPSFKQDLDKNYDNDLRISMHQFELDIEISQQPAPKQTHEINKKLTEDDYELQSPRKLNRRKNSNEY